MEVVCGKILLERGGWKKMKIVENVYFDVYVVTM